MHHMLIRNLLNNAICLTEEKLDEIGAVYSETLPFTLKGLKLKMGMFGNTGDSKERNYKTHHGPKGSTWQEFKHMQEQQV